MDFRISCFIDGSYFDKVLQTDFNNARLDYSKLADFMAKGVPLLRAYYYHCLPYQSNPPTLEESHRYANSEKFLFKLELLPKFEIRLGKLECRGKTDTGHLILVQKRIDVMLGIDLVKLSAKNQITHAAILTGDSDFLPAVQAAKDDGISISLFHGQRQQPHRDLYSLCDERVQFTHEDIQRMLRQ